MASDINHEINRLLHFAEQHDLINHEDRYYAANCLLDLLQADEYVPEEDLEFVIGIWPRSSSASSTAKAR